MATSINGLNKTLKFQQIFNDIRDDIVSSKIAPGSHLLGVRDLMKHYKVSYKTISMALQELEDFGLIRRRQGQGIFVQEKTFWKLGEAEPQRETQGLLGVIVPDLQRPYFVRLTNAIEQNTTAKGYNILLRNSNYDSSLEREIVEQFIAEGVRGILIVPTYDDDDTPFLSEIDRNVVPLLYVSRRKWGYRCSYIVPDNSVGVYETVSYLIQNGHRDIAYISIERVKNHDPIYKPFADCLKDHGLEVHDTLVQYTESLDPESGYQSMLNILDASKRPTALFCCYTDYLVVGAVKACRENELHIPDDMSIIGCGNDDITQLLEPHITIIRNPIEMMGHLAVNSIDDLIAQRIPAEKCIELKVAMEFRECGSVKNLLK